MNTKTLNRETLRTSRLLDFCSRKELIAQRPEINHSVSPDGVVKNGTKVSVRWPDLASTITDRSMEKMVIQSLINRLPKDYPNAHFGAFKASEFIGMYPSKNSISQND